MASDIDTAKADPAAGRTGPDDDANAPRRLKRFGGSRLGGLILATTLLVCHMLLSRLGYYFPRLSRLIDGKAQVLVDQGQVNAPLMHQELITREDLDAALRAGGCLHLHEVERATLETDGHITVVLRRKSP